MADRDYARAAHMSQNQNLDIIYRKYFSRTDFRDAWLQMVPRNLTKLLGGNKSKSIRAIKP